MLAVEQKMLIHQMDVTTAFLNGQLKEEIYMEQPPGYVQREKNISSVNCKDRSTD